MTTIYNLNDKLFSSLLRKVESMSIAQTWNKQRVAILLVITCAVCTWLLFRLPFYRGYFFGDDSLLVNDATNPNGSHGLLSDLFLVGGGKWRPLSTPLLLGMARRYGNNLVPFQVFSSLLLVSTGILVGILVYRVTRSSIPSTLTTVLVLSSPFTWLHQSWTYGVMESSALLCTVISIYLLIEIHVETIDNHLKIWSAFIFLFISTLIHERYIIVIFAIVFVHLLLPKHTQQKRIDPKLFLLIPVFHVIAKGFILGLNPLTSGGESPQETSLGFGVISHFLRGIQGVLGGLSGSGYYYGTSTFELRSNRNAASIIVPVGFACLILFLTVFVIATKNRYQKVARLEKTAGSVYAVALTGVVGFSLLIPGSTVSERFEGRWIFSAQLFIIATVLIAAHNFLQFGRFRYLLSIPLFVVLLTVNWAYKGHSSEYFIFRSQVDTVLTKLQKVIPEKKPWSLVLKPSDTASPSNWQFAYGYAMQQLRNPPYSSSFTTCPTYHRKIPCYSVQIYELSVIISVSQSD